MPRYNEGANLDPSQVQDVRGRGMGAPIAIGGGGLGLLVLVISMLLGVNPIDQVSSPSSGVQSPDAANRSEEHTSELQSLAYLVCRLLLEKKKDVNAQVSDRVDHPLIDPDVVQRLVDM